MTTRFDVPPAEFRRYRTPADVAPRERFDYWRTWYDEAVDCTMTLEPTGSADSVPTDFGCRADVLTAGAVKIIEVSNAPARGSWTRQSVEPADALRLVMFVGSSPPRYRWHGSTLGFPAGSAALVGRTGGEWHAPHGQRAIQVNVPRTEVPNPDRLDRMLGVALPTHPVLDMLVRPSLAGVAGRLEQLAGIVPGELAAFWTATMALLMSSLAECPPDPTQVAAARRAQAIRFIEARLADPALDPELIAAALHISRRTLYGLFATGDGTGVAAEIRRRRMKRARALLLDPRNGNRAISEIAGMVGIGGGAQFSRMFRAEFGQTPRRARAGANGQRP